MAIDEGNKELISQRGKKLEFEFRKQTVGYLIAAFGFVAGLAWNDALQTIINSLFPSARATIIVKLFYALLVTLLAVLFGIYASRFLSNEK